MALLVTELLVVLLWPLLLQLWLKSCHGTGINLPVVAE